MMKKVGTNTMQSESELSNRPMSRTKTRPVSDHGDDVDSMGRRNTNVMSECSHSTHKKAMNKEVFNQLVTVSHPLYEVNKATNMRDLFSGVEKAIKRLLKANDVHFLFMDKETVANYCNENGKTVRRNHKASHLTFDVLLPSEISVLNAASWDFKFRFDHIK